MAGAVRFTTEELIEIESRIVTAAERALAIEQEVFAELAAAIAAQEQQLGELAAALAELDCEAALAQLAAEQGYTRPVLDDSGAFEIRGGRHPGGRAGIEVRQGRRLHRERLRAGDAAPPTCRRASTRWRRRASGW